ncbi:MAG: hypothetical protein GX217_08180 [Clostridiaceae bacterium]|nr:hypothetical protein [Clostridiaceae bacterium]
MLTASTVLSQEGAQELDEQNIKPEMTKTYSSLDESIDELSIVKYM